MRLVTCRDQKTVKKLEGKIEEVIAGVILMVDLKKLPLNTRHSVTTRPRSPMP